MQALEELIAGVGAALREHQLLAIQFLIGGSQLIRGITHAEAGNPGAPGQVIQRVLHHDLALPLRLGQLPDVGDGRTDGIGLGVVEQLGQLDVQRGGGGGVLLINVGEDVRRLIEIEHLVLHVLIVQRTVLVLDVHHIGHILAGFMLAGDLFQQLVGGDVECHALQLGILGHEGLGYLAAAGGDGVQRHGAAFLDGLLIQLFIGLVGGKDVGFLLPLGQLGLAFALRLGRLLFLTSAGRQAEEHGHGQESGQPFLVLQHSSFPPSKFFPVCILLRPPPQ